jgi:glycosyltransferase involved in cell wall biosynthesis
LFGDAPVFGGAERYVELLATGFDRDEVAPRVVLAPEPALDPLASRLSAGGIPVARLARVSTLREFGAFLAVIRHLGWSRSQLLHFNLGDPRACNGAIVAARLALRSRILATNQLPQSPFDDLPTPLRHRIAMASIRHHIVVSEANKRDLLAAGVPESRITVIHNAVPDRGTPTPEERLAARRAIDPGATGPIVGFVGRLVAQKNPMAFIEAVGPAAWARRDALFVVFGEGPEQLSLETRAKQLGVASRIRFLGHRDDALRLFAGLDLLVFTSRYEGLPFAALEVMSLGVPVVAQRIPGFDEAVVDGQTGRLVDATPASTTEAILDLLARDAVRMAMGQAARVRVLERFSAREMVRKTVDVYRKLLASDRRL